ncbi:MAG: hypothetical protein HY747_02245 [Elusimicrobia bacterium]|nr:hypothetical protein [Elusimicrobiota bacterium]
MDNAGHAYAVGEIAEGFLPSDVYLFKLNSAGVLEWQQRIDEGTITTYKGGKLHVETFAMDAAVDAQGDLVLAGSHFQQEPLFTYQSLREFMTAKFSPTGLLKFKQFFKADIVPFKAGISSERGFATGVSIDPNDNIMTGGGEWVSSDKSTGFLQRGFLYGKLSPEGIPFIKQVHSVRGFTGSSGSDASGNFYLPGAPDRLDIAISKVGADGTLLWSTTTLRGLSNAEATGADVDQEGNVYVAGDLVPTQPSAGSKIVVLKYRQAVAPKATLSIRLEPEEVFPGGQTQITIHALDTSNNPVSDLDITLTAEAVAFSGGHDHNVNRPMGTFSGSGIMYSSPAHGKTGPDGKLFAVFTSTHFGGFETIQAHVTDTPAVSTSAALNVRVPGLEPMPPSSRYNLTGSSGLVSGNVRCAGEPIRHSQNHFGTQRTIATLESIILEYEDFLFDLNAVSLPIPGPIAIHKLGINNMSLPYGGLFDICSDWNPPYDGYHHAGTSVDIDPRGEILERPGEMMAIYPPALEDIIATRFVGVKRKKEKEAEFHYEFLP